MTYYIYEEGFHRTLGLHCKKLDSHSIAFRDSTLIKWYFTNYTLRLDGKIGKVAIL